MIRSNQYTKYRIYANIVHNINENNPFNFMYSKQENDSILLVIIIIFGIALHLEFANYYLFYFYLI